MKKGGFFKKTIKDIPLEGKTVLVRADYNVPLDKDGEISDDYRIRSNLPTLRYLLERQCKVVIVSHLGRPDGKPVKSMSLAPIAAHLSKLLGVYVHFVDECIGDKVRMSVKKAAPGSVLLLENLRFHAGEEADDESFAKAVAEASGASYFVQDGFGVVHRAHASTSAITRVLPSVAGLLLEKEYETLTEVMSHPKHPMVAILGGAKISDKISVIEKLIGLADTVVIGGAMANTFLQYRHYPIGKSIHEDGLDSILERIYVAAERKADKAAVDTFIVLPTDVAVATKIDTDARRAVVDRRDVSSDEYILDIGPSSMRAIDNLVEDAKTVVWNGTLGYAEIPQFAHGSARLALALASHRDIESVIGGGDTADFVLHWDSKGGGSFSHVSTGGGAGLELMAGQKMPGVESLIDASAPMRYNKA